MATAKLFYGVVVDPCDVSERLLESLGTDADEFDSEGLREFFDRNGVGSVFFVDNAQEKYGLHSGKVHRAEFGPARIESLDPGTGDFAGVLAALGLPSQAPAWHLVAER